MRLFGLGKPDVAKLKDGGDVGGLTLALKHKDAQIRRDAFEALMTLATEPQFRQVNEAALTALRTADAEAVAARFRSMLAAIPADTTSWRNSAVVETLLLLEATDALEQYYDRHVGENGGFFLQLSNLLVRSAAARRDLPLLKKLLLTGPFARGLRLGSDAETHGDAPHFAAIDQLVPRDWNLRKIGEVFAELAGEADLLEMAAAGKGGHALPIVYKKLSESGTRQCLPALEKLAAQDAEARAALGAVIGRLPSNELVGLIQGETTDRVKTPALLALCRRAEPESLVLIQGAIDHRDEDLAVAAIDAVGRLKPADAVTALAEVTNDPSPARARAAIRALASIGSVDAVRILLKLEPDRLLESGAMPAIAAAGQGKALIEVMTRRVGRLLPDQTMPLIRTLREIAPGPDLAELQRKLAEPHVAALDDSNWGRRKRAAEALGLIGGELAARSLESRLAQETDYERQQVLEKAIRAAR